MTTLSCTITKAGRCDEYGRALTVSQVYTGDYYFVKSLYQQGYCTVANVSVLDDDSTPYGYQIATIPSGSSAVSATTNPLTGGIVSLVVDSAAPSDADGRPDGTIYVQTV